MSSRIYYRHSIVELESLFSENLTNTSVLDALLEELTHRKNSRARKLQQAIESNHLKNKTNTESSITANTERIEPSLTHTVKEIDHRNEIITDWEAALSESNDSIERAVGNSPEISNKPQSILDTWTALEALSPQSYQREQDLVVGQGAVLQMEQGRPEPWNSGVTSIPKHQLYFHVYLGAVRLGPATEALLKTFGDDNPERAPLKGLASLGLVVVDRE